MRGPSREVCQVRLAGKRGRLDQRLALAAEPVGLAVKVSAIRNSTLLLDVNQPKPGTTTSMPS